MAVRAPSTGRRRTDGAISLLAGLAKCASCGTGVVLERGKYHCGGHRHISASTCQNDMHLDQAATEDAVLRAVEEFVLRPERVEDLLTARDRDRQDVGRAALEAELRDVRARAARLVTAFEASDAPAAVSVRLRELAEREKVLARALELARVRYDGGTVSLFDVLETERQLLLVRLEAITAQRERRAAIVDLYLALGG